MQLGNIIMYNISFVANYHSSLDETVSYLPAT